MKVFGAWRFTTDAGQNLRGLLEIALLDMVTRRFGEEEETKREDDGPEHLKGYGDTIRAGICSVLGAIIDGRREKDTKSDAELVTGDDGSSNLLWCDFRHIQNNDGGDETDTKPSNQATSYEKTEAVRSGLENDSNDEDEAAQNDGCSSANPISKITGNQGSKESASRENRGDG